MDMKPSLPFNISWAFAGRFAHAMHQWMLTVVLAWAGTAADVGLYGIAMAVVAPLFMFSALQLRDLAATERPGTIPFARYVQLRAVTALATFAVVLLVAGVSGFDRETAFAIAASMSDRSEQRFRFSCGSFSRS